MVLLMKQIRPCAAIGCSKKKGSRFFRSVWKVDALITVVENKTNSKILKDHTKQRLRKLIFSQTDEPKEF